MDAIERHRRGLDRESHGYIEENMGRLEREVRDAAARYAQEADFDDWARLGHRPVPGPLGIMLDERNPRRSRCIRSSIIRVES